MPPILRRPRLAAFAAAGAALVAGCSGGSGPGPAASPTAASASPSPSATPVAVRTCPLTGQPAKPGQDIRRVALAVKIDNIAPARPQAGLDHADIVVQETVEGGLTRLFAIFQCDTAATVGPIRSARTSDGDLLRLLNGAVFAFSGANPRQLAPVQATSKAVLISWDSSPSYFHVDPARPAVHNVFASTKKLLAAGRARNHRLKAPKPVFAYGKPAHRGRKVHSVSITWPAASAAWEWSDSTWKRTQDGSADMLADGKRVTAANVVVMSIQTRDTGVRDVLGNPSPDDVVTGKGDVWVFRNGRVIRGTWSRSDRTKPWKLTDSAGKPLRLQPGHTWVELVPQPGRPKIS